MYNKQILKLYYFLTKIKDSIDIIKDSVDIINNPIDIINEKIIELEKNYQVQVYKNKINLFKKLNNFTTCSLCLTDNILNIDLVCGHEICVECYEHDLKCYYKWCKCKTK